MAARLAGRARLFASALAVLALTVPSAALQLDGNERERARQMLAAVKQLLRNHYHDRTYKGLDLDAHFKAVHDRLGTVRSHEQAHALIADALLALGDSHTYFIPPLNADEYDYGWAMQMVGNECFVVAVDPRSDAAAKGLKAGDRLLRIEAFNPTRENLWKLQYAYYMLSPRPSLPVVVQSPGEAPRVLQLATRISLGPKVIEVNLEGLDKLVRRERDARLHRSRVARAGDVAIWKLPAFDVEPSEMDHLVREAIKGAGALVLDLRGNGGGLVKSLEQLTRYFFDRDVKIADLAGRRSMKPLVAKKRKDPFTGRLVVLIDSASGSAAELFARTVQIEKRGVVIGDRSAGVVMQAQFHAGVLELIDTVIFYGVSVTDADLIMTDGKSLEGTGVMPDEVLLPTAADMAAGRDPVLTRAAAILGASVDPAAAGALFPVEWRDRPVK
jgi:C-terminal processing protease CtpA/Prc